MDLEVVRDEENRISGPIFDTSAVGSIVVQPLVAGYDRDTEIVRSLGFGTKSWTLDRSIDLADVLTAEIQGAATAMGFSTSTSAGKAWTISGTLADVFVESKAGFWGGMQHYGYMALDVKVVSPDGEQHARRLRIHEFIVNANAGFSQRDEIMEAVARLIVEAAPEVLAQVNRHYLHAPPSPTLPPKLALLESQGLSDSSKTALRSIGLSGDPTASPVLLSLLRRSTDEDDRCALIAALANLGAADAVTPLRERFSSEDEDCRFLIVKALDYIGSPEARDAIVKEAVRDEAEPIRLRAELIRDQSPN